MRRFAVFVGAFAVMLSVVAACAKVPEVSPTSDLPFMDAYAQILADATSAEASDEQLGEIEMYLDGRPIPFSVVRDAMARTFGCLEINGFEYSSTITEGYPGFFRFEFTFAPKGGMTDDSSPAVADRCQEMESAFITALYDNQPGVLEARDTAFQEQKPELIQCLRDHSISVDDDATYDEINTLAVKLYRDSDFTIVECMPPA